jgi:hypothetical protein
VDTLDKRMIHVVGDDVQRLHHATQIGVQFKTYALFTSEIFHLIFWTIVDHG